VCDLAHSTLDARIDRLAAHHDALRAGLGLPVDRALKADLRRSRRRSALCRPVWKR
jgi:adenylosuccinate synthase